VLLLDFSELFDWLDFPSELLPDLRPEVLLSEF
jgi:hypothetical protein